MLDRDLEEAEEQYGMSVRAHMQVCGRHADDGLRAEGGGVKIWGEDNDWEGLTGSCKGAMVGNGYLADGGVEGTWSLLARQPNSWEM
jgi:hypothetical protein